MGVDLTLLRVVPIGNDWAYSPDVLTLMRRHALWEIIRELPTEAIPPDFISYVGLVANIDHGSTQIDHDPYGDPLRLVTAAQLLTVADHVGVRDNWQNRAVWAYLAELPPDQRFVLYWN